MDLKNSHLIFSEQNYLNENFLFVEWEILVIQQSD